MDSPRKIPFDDALMAFTRESFISQRDAAQRFIDLTVEAMDAEIGYFHLYNEETEAISLGVWSAQVFKQCTTSHLSHYPLKDAGIWVDSIRQRKAIFHNDYPNLSHRHDLPEGHFPLENHLSAPIYDEGSDRIVAIAGVGNRGYDFTQQDCVVFESFLKKAWHVLDLKLEEIKHHFSDRAKLFSERNPEELLSEMISTIGKALELRDEYTNMHQSNVAHIAGRIAEYLELPEQQIFGLKLGASIHDIGKISVPTEILTKPGKLHPAEFELVKTHAEIGAQLFRSHELPWPIADMIEQHHERMDGSGYPKGLLGKSICIEARIIAVADTFDAISSNRPYRYAPGPHHAVRILTEGRELLYDTYVLDAFLELLEHDRSIRDLYGMP